MASPNSLFNSLLFLSSLLLLLPSIQSRTILPSNFQHLDVSNSISKTLEILSINKPLKQDDTQSIPTTFSSNSSSALSVPLYSRDVISSEEHDDYKSLVSSRLERDVARVNWISSRLGLEQVSIQPEDLSTAVQSRLNQLSGEYFAQVGFGTPAKTLHLIIDTGSDVSWVQCKPCKHCPSQTDPIYDPTGSSTYSTVPCSAPVCLALDHKNCSANSNKCLYQVYYRDSSNTAGELITDTMSFGSAGSVPKLAFGCGQDNRGHFAGSAALLGLGGGSLSFLSQIKATSFSYCLPDRDSRTSSTLDFNSAQPRDAITTQLTKNTKLDTFFYAGVTDLAVAGRSLGLSPSLFAAESSGNGIIIDSGTTISRLRAKAYETLRHAFRSLTTNLTSAKRQDQLDTCYDLSGVTKAKVPTVGFVFAGGKMLNLPAKNYMMSMDSSGTYCFAFAPDDEGPSIMGNVQLQGFRVSYDLARSLVGFSPGKC